MHGRQFAGWFVAASLFASPLAALAQDDDDFDLDDDEPDFAESRGFARFDVHLDLGWAAAGGVGFRGDFRVARDIIERADDDLALSLGAELFVTKPGLAVWPMAAMQWNFYLGHRWSVFPEAGLVVFTGEPHHRDRVGAFAVVVPFLGAGARLHFSPRHAVLFRINWPAGLQIGLTF